MHEILVAGNVHIGCWHDRQIVIIADANMLVLLALYLLHLVKWVKDPLVELLPDLYDVLLLAEGDMV